MEALKSKRNKKFTYFVGVDVSRDKLDYTILKDREVLLHETTINSPEPIIEFITKLKVIHGLSIAKTVFAMEHTGFYCNHLLGVLVKLRCSIVQENALHLKRSIGLVRGKNDKIDSLRIAQYIQRNKDDLKLWSPRRPVLDELAGLFRLRKRLQGISNMLKKPLDEQAVFVKKKQHREHMAICRKSQAAVSQDLELVDLAIKQLVSSDEQLKKLYELITSVPRIGPVTAWLILISTNEFKDINDPKKFACYAGVAPFDHSSGRITRKGKVSKIANREMKALLHLCAMGAIREVAELKEYYERKKAEGKPSMLVLNAIRNKLISRVFSCVNQGRPFVKRNPEAFSPAKEEHLIQLTE